MKHSEYNSSYIEQINLALKNMIFYNFGKNISPEIFYQILIKKTEEISKDNGTMFFFGNGASASFSNHMTLDWSKNGKIKSLSLSDSSLLTALSNDYSYETSFTEFFKIYKSHKNNMIITTSSSGNSNNITNVLNYAKNENIFSLGLSALKSDNNTIKLSKLSIYIPCKTYGIAECVHQVFHHIWLDMYMKIYEWDRSEYQNMNSKNFKL